MTIIDNHSTVTESFWATATDYDAGTTISFDRCVDWLLDLHQSSDHPVIRQLIADVIDDLRCVGPIEGEFEDVVLGALASVESAIEVVEQYS